METFIIRIYRNVTSKPETVIGVAEHIETGKKIHFKNLEELNGIILIKEHTVSAEE